MTTINPSSNSKASNPQSASSWEGSLAREQYLYLTTRGRKSGLPREIEIWFTFRQGRFYVIAEYPTSHWVQNLHADPHIEVRAAGKKFPARARAIDADTEPQLHRTIQEQSRNKYGWGDGLVIELAPS